MELNSLFIVESICFLKKRKEKWKDIDIYPLSLWTRFISCLSGESVIVEKDYTNIIFPVIIDSNGNEEPNLSCKDRFAFVANVDGMVYDE